MCTDSRLDSDDEDLTTMRESMQSLLQASDPGGELMWYFLVLVRVSQFGIVLVWSESVWHTTG